MTFLDLPTITFVLAFGCFALWLSGFRPRPFYNSLRVLHSLESFENKCSLLLRIARQIKKEGPVVASRFEHLTDDPLLKKGLRLLADNLDKTFDFETTLRAESYCRTAEVSSSVYYIKFLAESLPAIGLTGTLIGLVQGSSSISFAILSTLYGAFLGNIVLMPLFHRYNEKVKYLRLLDDLVISALKKIRDGVHPQLLQEHLTGYILKNEQR